MIPQRCWGWTRWAHTPSCTCWSALYKQTWAGALRQGLSPPSRLTELWPRQMTPPATWRRRPPSQWSPVQKHSGTEFTFITPNPFKPVFTSITFSCILMQFGLVSHTCVMRIRCNSIESTRKRPAKPSLIIPLHYRRSLYLYKYKPRCKWDFLSV